MPNLSDSDYRALAEEIIRMDCRETRFSIENFHIQDSYDHKALIISLKEGDQIHKVAIAKDFISTGLAAKIITEKIELLMSIAIRNPSKPEKEMPPEETVNTLESLMLDVIFPAGTEPVKLETKKIDTKISKKGSDFLEEIDKYRLTDFKLVSEPPKVDEPKILLSENHKNLLLRELERNKQLAHKEAHRQIMIHKGQRTPNKRK
jgi:hypothetical protein